MNKFRSLTIPAWLSPFPSPAAAAQPPRAPSPADSPHHLPYTPNNGLDLGLDEARQQHPNKNALILCPMITLPYNISSLSPAVDHMSFPPLAGLGSCRPHVLSAACWTRQQGYIAQQRGSHRGTHDAPPPAVRLAALLFIAMLKTSWGATIAHVTLVAEAPPPSPPPTSGDPTSPPPPGGRCWLP